jgi:hypothetical protein
MEVARSSRKIAYGGIRSENRAFTPVGGPLTPTSIIPHLAALVKCFFIKKCKKKLVGLPPVPAKVIQRVAVFHFFFLNGFIVMLARSREGVIFRELATRIILALFLVVVSAVGAFTFVHYFHSST